jgi:hypothetical protein
MADPLCGIGGPRLARDLAKNREALRGKTAMAEKHGSELVFDGRAQTGNRTARAQLGEHRGTRLQRRVREEGRHEGLQGALDVARDRVLLGGRTDLPPAIWRGRQRRDLLDSR